MNFKKCLVLVFAMLLALAIGAVAFAEEEVHVHTWDAVAKQPTCTETGLKICMNCGETEEIAKLGHSFADGVCTVCGEKDPDAAPEETPAPHVHKWVEHITNCLEDGWKLCETCGELENLGKGPHSWNDVVKAPTCTEKGLKICSNCGETEEIAALDHTAGDAATCTTAQTCIRCDYVFAAALGHTEETIPAVKPTCTETGLTEGTKCSVCGAILAEQAVVEAKGHSYRTEVFPATQNARGYTKHSCVRCGKWYRSNIVPELPDCIPGVDLSSIVLNADMSVALSTNAKQVTAKATVLVVTAEDASSLKHLVLSTELIAALKDAGITEVHFLVGKPKLQIPMSIFDKAEVVALGATGYVITVDPAAVDANGSVGYQVSAAATVNGENVSIMDFVTEMVIKINGVKNAIAAPAFFPTK